MSSRSVDVVEWRKRIKGIQSERVTPDVLQRIQENASRRKRAERSYKTAQFLERVNNVSSASNAVTLRAMSSAAPESAPAIMGQTTSVYSARSNVLQSMLVSKKSRTPSRNIESPSNDEDVEDAQEEELQNERLQQLEMELSAARCPPMASPLYDGDQQQATPSADGDVATQTEATTREVDQLLELFAVEPSEEAELAAKFTLFENFLANVTAIRTQTLEFWEENKDQFVGASGAACEREIKAIDSTDAMGIDDSALSKWFVHAMTKKANQNNAAITQTLAKLRSRLELLAGELGECPCCLDAMQAETCTTLGCCHKVCTDCWDHWVELKGAAAFCPLCKHREFVEEVLGGTFG